MIVQHCVDALVDYLVRRLLILGSATASSRVALGRVRDIGTRTWCHALRCMRGRLAWELVAGLFDLLSSIHHLGLLRILLV